MAAKGKGRETSAQKARRQALGIGWDAATNGAPLAATADPWAFSKHVERAVAALDLDRGIVARKFYVPGRTGWAGTVKVKFPSGSDDRVRDIIDKFPYGSNVADVSQALAKVGAEFVNWADGSPGYMGMYV